MQAPVAVRCFTNCYTLPFYLLPLFYGQFLNLTVHTVTLTFNFNNQKCTRQSAFASDNGVSTPENHASLLRRAPNTSTWDFPDVVKFHVAVHTTQNHASLLRCAPNTDFPDVIKFRVAVHGRKQSGSGIRTILSGSAQKLISSSVSRHLSTRNISSKFMHACLSNFAHRQTDRQTNERKHIPLPLSDVNYSVLITCLCHAVSALTAHQSIQAWRQHVITCRKVSTVYMGTTRRFTTTSPQLMQIQLGYNARHYLC